MKRKRMIPVSEWGSAKPSRFAAVCIGAIRHKIARGLLKKSVRSMLASMGGPFDVEVDGLRLRCHVTDNTSERAVVERGIEGIDILQFITKDLGPGDVFFDVGANCGVFALYAAKKVGPQGRVVAIEAIPAMIERLRFNIRANDFSNVELVEAAVGETSGTLTLYVDTDYLGRSCAFPMEGYKPVSVPMLSLKSVVETAGIEKIDALKIDIEGHEDRALLPFVASAPKEKWPKKIMMEILLANRWEKDCIGALIKAGYLQTWRSKQDILLEL
jgi:FkbM family methyltransferase